MGTITRMDGSGDTPFHFDPADAASLAEAEKIFQQLRGEGRRAFIKDEGPVEEFDPTAAEIVFLGPLAGG